MADKAPLRIHEQVTASGGTYDYVKSSIVPPGQIWCLNHIAYENETGARGTFRRYYEGHGYNHWLAELAGPGAGELVFTDTKHYMIPGERLCIRQATCTANDVLTLYAEGYIIFGSMIPEGE
jgi:hypothetical protein